MANTQLTWSDIADFVQEVHSKEGARPNPAFYRRLGNQALAEISEIMGGINTEWGNAAVTGVLTISGNSVALPIDCLNVTEVEWDGFLLEETSIAQMNAESPGWRNDTADAPAYWMRDGHNILFEAAPTITTAGILVIRGTGALPDFSEAQGATNPLTYLPSGMQLSPAYYIMANLPVNVENKTEVSRQSRYQAMWERELSRMQNASNRRRYEPVRY